MIDPSLFEHKTLPEPEAKNFLLVNALNPYLNITQIARILSTLKITPPESKKWDFDQVSAVRAGYVKADQIFQNWCVSPGLAHDLTEEAVKNDEIVAATLNVIQKLKLNHAVTKQWIYLAFYLNVFPESVKLPKLDDRLAKQLVITQYFAEANLTTDWIHSHPYVRKVLFLTFTEDALYNAKVWVSFDVLMESIEKMFEHGLPDALSKDDTRIIFNYAILRCLRGLPWKDSLTEYLDGGLQEMLVAFEHFIKGNFDDTYKILINIAETWSKNVNLRQVTFLPDILGVALYLSRLVTQTNLNEFFDNCTYIVYNIYSNDERIAYLALQDLYRKKYYPRSEFNYETYLDGIPKYSGSSILSRILFYYVCVKENDPKFTKPCLELRDKYKDACPVVGHLLNDILEEVGAGRNDIPPVEYGSWLALAQGFAKWELQLNSLADALGQGEDDNEKKHRLVWIIDPDELSAYPLAQVRSAKGKWSSGQKFAVKRLNDDLPYLTEQDRRMRHAYEYLGYSGYYDTRFNADIAFRTLVDHPYLFLEGSREHITLELRPVEINIKEVGTNCSISIDLEENYQGVALKEIRPGAWGVYILDRKTQAIKNILGEEGMSIPSTKLSKFLDMVQDVREVKVNLDTTTPTKDGDTIPTMQLWQKANVFQAALRIKPSGTPSGTAFVPGEGSEDILQLENNRPVIFHRNFAAETEGAKEILALCPILNSMDGHWDWYSEDISEFFELISELKAVTDICHLEWPSGEKFRLVGDISRSQISIKTKKSGDWFSLSGEAKIDEDHVIELSELLERSTGSSGRFVQLKNGEFLALSDDVKRSLDRLRLLSTKRKGSKERAIHPLAGPLVDDLCKDMVQQADISWNEMVSKMNAAFALKPEVPATLQADLRPYQKEGFVWLCRLSEWGVGGCLADDMGLGKTIQSIAVMLREAQKGPCLIIAPTSVCPNWEEELHRFAPSLHVVRLKEAEDRREMVERMKKGMVLITGYGLLPREQEILAEHQWQMVVFDEAQALKNSATKRSKAASSIPAHFHLALTGTPIENRLEDLWSVFDIINPGLLGTLNDFHRRFSGAEEGGSAAQALKMLIRPFILRRLKGQVLDDLPELTEQTIIIEPTAKEAAFYESVRRRALAHLDDGPQGKGQKRFNILTELTRLRRACCHASLVDANVGSLVEPVSSKLLRFLELLEEARSGGHRLLVFSQFTGHLALVREELDKRHIPYQYLDGSTPEEKRREGVAAFQRGQGDLFLISLKAGGQGLNLTAADYVVHLDPWWNPAVEDQATDRAHRIGQKKTVTVYRLVMAHSVEEKILKLHAQKRDLAADFLEGHEEAVTQATLSEEELMALLS